MPVFQNLHVIANKEALWTPYLANFVEASSSRCDQSLTLFSALLPSQEKPGGAKNSTFLTMAQAFLWWALIQEPSESPLRVTTSREITRVSGVPGQEPEAQANIYFPRSHQHFTVRYAKPYKSVQFTDSFREMAFLTSTCIYSSPPLFHGGSVSRPPPPWMPETAVRTKP